MNLWELSDLSTPWCVHVVATLRIDEQIAAGHGEIRDLAQSAGVDADSLQRVMRHLVKRGLFEESAPGQFELNALARELAGARSGFDLEGFGGRMANAWSTLLSAVRTGKPAYHEAFGRNFWEDLEANPKIGAEFDELMGPGHGTPDPEVLVYASDWENIRTVVDVGGGTGALLAEILRAHPAVHGTLVDVPRAVAKAAELFAAAGVSDRVTTVAQSFFDPLPGGSDVYVLKSVLGDWADPEATEILKRCAEAAGATGRVVVFTGVGPGEAASPELLMMVLVGGRGRTIDEFREMAGRAGLRMDACGRQASGKWIVEFRKA